MQPKNREDKLMLAVRSGWIEVRPDGTIWRIAIRSKDRWHGRVTVKPCEPHRIDAQVGVGYRTVKCMVDGVQSCALAHRLVWLILVGPIPPGLTINHKNGDKGDNRPDNLELATYSEQQIHANRVLGTGAGAIQVGESNHQSRFSDGQIREIRRRRAAGERLSVLASAFGCSQQHVSKIARGERRSTS